ncbi:hypothetical protein FIBSPDRAFT_876000, partial [Athelia psychrophila]
MSTGAQLEVSVVKVLGICEGIEVHLHGDVHEGEEVNWENNYRLDYNPHSSSQSLRREGPAALVC